MTDRQKFVVEEFRRNIVAIVEGHDPLDDAQYFQEYIQGIPQPEEGCEVEGCADPVKAIGLCNKHYARLRTAKKEWLERESLPRGRAAHG